MLRSFFLSIVLCSLFLREVLSTGTCWTEPQPVTCNGTIALTSQPSQPSHFPFFFFPVVNDEFDLTGSAVAEAFQLFQPEMWLSTIDHADYQLNINNLYCIPNNYTTAIQEALQAFTWSSFTVTIADMCCEPGYLEMCVDDPSQVLLRNFSAAIRQQLLANGIPAPSLQLWQDDQPPFHITLGTFSSGYNISEALTSLPFLIDQPITLDSFYFGDQQYFASNAYPSWPYWAYIVIAGGILIICLPFLLCCFCSAVRKCCMTSLCCCLC